MLKTRILPALLVAGAAAGVGAHGAHGATAFQLKADFSQLSRVNVGPKHISPGDAFYGSGPLTRNGAASGRIEFIDHPIDKAYQGTIQETALLLPGGTLFAEATGLNKTAPGAPKPSDVEQFAVTGGTGNYAHATGTISEAPIGNSSTQATLTFHLRG